jgi:L,D-transpeptidase ErfK/SrfK
VAIVERALIEGLIADPRGIAVPVSRTDLTLEGYLAHAPQVENRLPLQATWDGVDEPSTEEGAAGE